VRDAAAAGEPVDAAVGVRGRHLVVEGRGPRHDASSTPQLLRYSKDYDSRRRCAGREELMALLRREREEYGVLVSR